MRGFPHFLDQYEGHHDKYLEMFQCSFLNVLEFLDFFPPSLDLGYAFFSFLELFLFMEKLCVPMPC